MGEQVVLVDDGGHPIGVAEKSEVHTAHTALHLAFSCYLVDDAGELLVTRRALTKPTWPGVWTNSACGHPAPHEAMTDAIMRRARDELGLEITDIRSALPDFRYRAVDASGIVENEVCPVFIARAIGSLRPDPAEVAEWAWVSAEALAGSLECTPFVFSPWLRLQFPQLMDSGVLRW